MKRFVCSYEMGAVDDGEIHYNRPYYYSFYTGDGEASYSGQMGAGAPDDREETTVSITTTTTTTTDEESQEGEHEGAGMGAVDDGVYCDYFYYYCDDGDDHDRQLAESEGGAYYYSYYTGDGGASYSGRQLMESEGRASLSWSSIIV